MLNFYAISAAINFIASALLGTIVLFTRKSSKGNVLFALFALSVAVWSAFYFLWQLARDASEAMLFAKLFLAAAVLIPIFFFHFVTVFTKDKVHTRRLLVFAGYVIGVIFILFSFTDFFLAGVSERLSFPFWPVPGQLFPLFLATWLFYVVYSFYILFFSYKKSEGETKLQLYLLLLGLSIGFSGGITNYFLWYEIPIPPVGNIMVSFYVILVSYAIIKHKLFNIKVIFAELSVLLLWIATLIRTVLSDGLADLLLNGVYLGFVTLFGIFVIYNVRNEVAQRTEIEKLMSGLARANRRLKAMDKQKSEFISIASHQLRSPLTAIRGYASMLLEGSYGKFPRKAHQPLEMIAESARMMAISIEDYLSVSRIESGNMKFDYSDFSITEQVERVTDSLRAEAIKRGLLLTFKNDVTDEAIVHADRGKVQQILHNLINNALKYTLKGSITVYVHDNQEQEKIFVEVIDTGIGMSKETQEGLFQKFQRATNASMINVHGTGLGLYVARKMANEMNGDIYAYSEGEGKGSHFILELSLL